MNPRLLPAFLSTLLLCAAAPAQSTRPAVAPPPDGDARVTSTVEPTKAAMETAGKAYEPHVYPGAGHGFLRQQGGRDGANEKAARDAWSRTIAFFKEHLEAK